MLLGGIAVFSLLVAAAVCFGFGAFSGPGWLWMLPVSFVCTFLEGLVAAVVFLWIVCKMVDPEQEQEADDPFYRKVVALYVEALIMLMGVRVHTAGLEKTPKEGRFLLVCNHLFDADPGILLHYFKNSQLAFISKKENQKLPFVGKLMHKILCQPLDRENDRQALKVILRCIRIIKEDRASIAVFPEGYTSRDNKLHHFRPGVFKIAQKANVPIVVCTIQNTRPIIRNAMHLKKTDVQLHLVDVIPAEELKGKTTVEISDRVYAMMLTDLGPEFALSE